MISWQTRHWKIYEFSFIAIPERFIIVVNRFLVRGKHDDCDSFCFYDTDNLTCPVEEYIHTHDELCFGSPENKAFDDDFMTENS